MAVMVTPPVVAGAVNSPDGLIVPELADQVKAVFEVVPPWTFALHCKTPPIPIIEGVQVTLTAPVGVGVGLVAGVVFAAPPPHPLIARSKTHRVSAELPRFWNSICMREELSEIPRRLEDLSRYLRWELPCFGPRQGSVAE